MSKGIEISFLSNVRDFTRGAGNVDDALERVSDSLDDMVRDGDRATDTLARSFRDVSDEARDATRDVERIGDAADTAGRHGTRISDGISEGADGASEAVGDFKSEAISNMSETVSSFRGEWSDFAQIAQDTLGGVIADLGPLGVAAGAAGAVGLGLLMASIEKAKEREQELRDRIGELAGELIDTGGVGADAFDGLADRLRELATETDDSKDSLAELRKQTENSASGFAKLADAYAGNARGIDQLIEKERKEYNILAERHRNASSWHASERNAIADKRDAQKAVVDGLEEAKAAAEGAEEAEAAWLASNGPMYQAKAEQINTLQGALDDAIGTWQEYADEETGAADPEKYMAAMQARIDATTNFNDNVQTLAQTTGLSFEEAQAVLDQGIDFAPTLASIVAGGEESMTQYADLVRQIIGGGQEIADGTPLSTTIRADADTDGANKAIGDVAEAERKADIYVEPILKAAQAALEAEAKRQRITKIVAEADTKKAAADLDALASKARTATVTARAELFAAQQAIDLLTQPRTMTITADIVDREGRPVR